MICTGKNRRFDVKLVLILAKTVGMMQKYKSYLQKQKLLGKNITHTCKNRRYDAKYAN